MDVLRKLLMMLSLSPAACIWGINEEQNEYNIRLDLWLIQNPYLCRRKLKEEKHTFGEDEMNNL